MQMTAPANELYAKLAPGPPPTLHLLRLDAECVQIQVCTAHLDTLLYGPTQTSCTTVIHFWA